MRPRCSDEWDEDEEAPEVNLLEILTRIEWREDLAENFYEEMNDDEADQDCS